MLFEHIGSAIWGKFCRVLLAVNMKQPDPKANSAATPIDDRDTLLKEDQPSRQLGLSYVIQRSPLRSNAAESPQASVRIVFQKVQRGR